MVQDELYDGNTPNFTDNGDATITDNVTGLMWTQDDSGEGLNLQEALVWVDDKNNEQYLGYSEWRLPDTLPSDFPSICLFFTID